MFIGVLSLRIRLHAVFSLKEKRKLSNSIRQKIRNKFNVSVAEIDNMDDKTELSLAISMVCNERKRIDSTLSKVLSTVEALTDQEVSAVNMEIFGA
ncbi:MAG: DUF503 domain-containing protein [Desulfonatronovibrionaceae bacterium]